MISDTRPPGQMQTIAIAISKIRIIVKHGIESPKIETECGRPRK